MARCLTRDDRAARNKKLFEDAVRAQLVRPKLTAIEWPEGSLQLIASEFTRRETAEKKRLADVLAREKERAAKINKAVKPGLGPNPFEQAAAGKAGGSAPNPFEEAARGNTRTSPANPFELAHEGVRAGPENPFEKEAWLEAEERARQEAIRREQERQAEIARQERERQTELARVERERKEMEARAEAQRRRDYQEALAAADRAYHRAYNQQNREKASWEANQSRGSFKAFLDLALFGNNSAPSGYVDPNKIVGHVPSSRSGGSGNQSGAGAGGGSGTSLVDRACMACGGSGRVLSAKSEAAYQRYKAELEANKGKGGVVPGFSGEEVACSACGGTGQR